MPWLKTLLMITSVATQVCYNKPMVDTTWVDESHGLSLDEGPHAHRDNENGVLFYLEYILLMEAHGLDITDDVREFRIIVEKLRTHAAPLPDDGLPFTRDIRIKGLYDRGADESMNKDKLSIRVISHDNLTAIAAFDARYGVGDEAGYIVEHGLRNFLRYDNAYPDKPRWNTIQWPTDWAFWSLSSNKLYLKVLSSGWLPLFAIRCILSNMSAADDTSGKLLNFVRFASHRDKSLPMKLLWKLYKWQMKRMYGDDWLHSLMCIYFHNPNHPLRNLSEHVEF